MLISLENIQKYYKVGKEEFHVLKSLNLQINSGEFVVIMGKSGSGKTTLLNILGFLDRFNEGQYFFDGKDVTNLSENQRSDFRNSNVGFIFQQFRLIPTLSALDNALLPLLVSEAGIDLPKKENVIQLFHKYGLKNQLNKYPGKLSGGEQQRVAIIRALVNEPDIILADEPTGRLDSKMSEFVFDTLQQIHEEDGKTVIYITHNMNLVKKASRIIKIEDGSVVSDETC